MKNQIMYSWKTSIFLNPDHDILILKATEEICNFRKIDVETLKSTSYYLFIITLVFLTSTNPHILKLKVNGQILSFPENRPVDPQVYIPAILGSCSAGLKTPRADFGEFFLCFLENFRVFLKYGPTALRVKFGDNCLKKNPAS